MTEWNEDLKMYQWANHMNPENVYAHPSGNSPASNNAEVIKNHNHYMTSHRPHQTNAYRGGLHYPKAETVPVDNIMGSARNGNNYDASIHNNANMNVNYASGNLSGSQVVNSDLYPDQFKSTNANNYEAFNNDSDQYNQQRYGMLFNTVNPNMPASQHSDDGIQYSEHLMSPNAMSLHPTPCNSNGASVPSTPKSQLLDNFLGNWTSNPSGTYTPFGHTYLNVQPNLLLQKENITPNSTSKSNCTAEKPTPIAEPNLVKQSEVLQRKDADGISFSDVGGKKRIIAEVKPMRPSYSAVLSKTPKTNYTPESNKKKDVTNKDFMKANNTAKVTGNKQEKFKTQSQPNEKPQFSDEKTKKSDADKKNFLFPQMSSSSESGDVHDINNKSNKSKNKTEQSGRKYISLDDLMNDDDAKLLEEKPGYNNCDSEFVFVNHAEDKGSSKKRNKKAQVSKNKNTNKKEAIDESANVNKDEDDYCDTSMESEKFKKKTRDNKSSNTTRKILSEKNKKNSQSRNKKPKMNGYLGKLQNVSDRWIVVLKNVLFWFYNLLSDIFQMSMQLSIDFASISYKNTYSWVSDASQHIKEKITSPQWLIDFVGYIDKRIGHTWVGFWRNLKFLKFMKFAEDNNSQKQTNTNIPLPATGDEAMKRLLACKGKDPYSILGVGIQCSDDDIKRYYRRQAFLVHPDKNQQPGAEEAFKILQHAFDLIGVPACREAYDRKLVESAKMEATLSEVAELLAQLQDKVKHAAGTIRCTNCCRRHVRTITSRPAYAARYCQQCKIRHAAKEGDIWAESQLWGLIWKYYACMDGAVYQITQWASCQRKNLKHLVANTHHVQYRIVLGNNKAPSSTSAGTGNKQNFNSGNHDANLEDFLNNLYSKTGQQSGDAKNVNSTTTSGETNKTRRKAKKCKT